MNRIFFLLLLTANIFTTTAQVSSYRVIGGSCGKNMKWTYSAGVLTIGRGNDRDCDGIINDYHIDSPSPWNKKKLEITRVVLSPEVIRIGSCAFANCEHLEEVVLETEQLSEIGWGAFIGCKRLHYISFPNSLQKIETIAFANCSSMNAVFLPGQCKVEDQAFLNCTNIDLIDLNPTTILGRYVFAQEIIHDGKPRHALFRGELKRVPGYINSTNCHEYGISTEAFEKTKKGTVNNGSDYDLHTADVDSLIPEASRRHQDIYALIIGNQNYRFASDVPYAIHDARIFRKYCESALGVPVENIHICEDATKQMILEDEMDWVSNIQERESKHLIVYYAGHGVPDRKNGNKAYLLPTDVRGVAPQRGISLDDFYAMLGNLGFAQTSVFLDACFCGINRDNAGVNVGLRGVEIDAEEGTISSGNMIVFSAAQGNETAQGYPEVGHGLFTYYLLKNLQENPDNTFGNLSENIQRMVSIKAPQLRMQKPQTPSVNVSQEILDWEQMKF